MNENEQRHQIDDEEARQFAGLAVGSLWKRSDGSHLEVKRLRQGQDNGDQYVRVIYDSGREAAETMLTRVRDGTYSPVNAIAEAAHHYAINTAESGPHPPATINREKAKEALSYIITVLESEHEAKLQADSSAGELYTQGKVAGAKIVRDDIVSEGWLCDDPINPPEDPTTEYPIDIDINVRDDGYVEIHTAEDSPMGRRTLLLQSAEYEMLEREIWIGGDE